MPIEISRKANAEKVIWQICGAERDFLPSHLLKHRVSSDKYRKEFGLPDTVPLHSIPFAKSRSDSRKSNPDFLRFVAKEIKYYDDLRKEQIDNNLVTGGLFTPRTASILTGIPLTTIQSAAQTGRLEYGLATLVFHMDNGKIIFGRTAKLIRTVDLYKFVMSYRRFR